MQRIKGQRLRRPQGYRCGYCDEPGARGVAVGLHACQDAAACSDRMEAQGMGRRDWTADDRAGMRASLVGVLTRGEQA